MGRLAVSEVRAKILEGIIDGKSLRTIAAEDGMPSVSTIMRWLQDDEEWREQYARAREAGDDAMAEDIQAIADRTDLDANDKRIRVDARKWLLSKRQPKKYGDATTIKHADANGEKMEMDEVTRAARLAALAAQINRQSEQGEDAAAD